MTYQIVYFSPGGHARTVAETLAQLLPEGTPCDPLDARTPWAQVQLVGFEYQLTDGRQLPAPVEAYLKSLSGKTVFLFSTVSFQLCSAHSSALHRLAEAALPRDCDYRGMHLCPMEPHQETLTAFRDHADQNPDNLRVRHWLDRHEQAQGHPDDTDLEEAKVFARHVLELQN